MKFKKKPLIIEAFKCGFDDIPVWFSDKINSKEIVYVFDKDDIWCEIKTLEGVMTARYGDYILKGIIGEIYSCKEIVFKASYEEAE